MNTIDVILMADQLIEDLVKEDEESLFYTRAICVYVKRLRELKGNQFVDEFLKAGIKDKVNH